MTSQITRLLARSELFLGLSDADASKIASLSTCVLRSYRLGECIFQPKEPATDLFILGSGQILITSGKCDISGSAERWSHVENITKGGTFGVSALAPPYVRGLYAIAEKDSQVIAIGTKDLVELFDREPQIGYEILKGLIRVFATKIRNVEQFMLR